ncbi:MAG: hypothetical protein HY078_15325 [Elusimicrobia bacterium]|nr:hypothetical protein [Elusimicrobiota bacterium]
MKSPHPFGAVLARLRREQGYHNAHAFFQSAGGARILRLSYANYLALERGRSLPKPKRFQAIMQSLGLPPGSAQRAELLRSYLASLLGGDELLADLDGGQASQAPAPLRLGEEVARQYMRQRSVNLTMTQWKLLAVNRAAYDCCIYLNESPGLAKIADVAEATGLSVGATREAIKELSSAKLVKMSGERVTSRFTNKVVNLIAMSPQTSGLAACIIRNRHRLLDRSKVVKDWCITTRISRRNLQRYEQHLQETLDLAAIYGDEDKAPDTHVFAFQGRVVEIFP